MPYIQLSLNALSFAWERQFIMKALLYLSKESPERNKDTYLVCFFSIGGGGGRLLQTSTCISLDPR